MHLNNPLLFSPSMKSCDVQMPETPRRQQGLTEREIDDLKQRLSRAESQMEKANLKVQQLKLKKQTI